MWCLLWCVCYSVYVHICSIFGGSGWLYSLTDNLDDMPKPIFLANKNSFVYLSSVEYAQRVVL